MKYFSLFSGIGGFELGIQYAVHNLRSIQQENTERPNNNRNTENKLQQWECVGYSEIDKYAIKIYEEHFQKHKNYGDITKIKAEELPDFDLLVGGFPCQAFSIAGKRGGFDDTRGTLFFDLARIAKAKVPMFLLLENVKGLVSHNSGQTLEVILETLQELGYYTNYEIHNSKDHGVPQNRERIFFLCKHIKGLTSVGQSQKMTTYDKIIQEYLFQLLLNNLVEVKKLQGLASKDSILGYLLLKEIKEKLPNPDISESILGGISTLTVENISQLKGEEVWQNIDMCLKSIWVYDSNELSKYTTSTAIKQIIDSKTYTYSRMFQAISLATVHLRNSQKNLWNEILSGLIVIQENTKYARVNNENEETIITESGTAHRKSELQDARQYFALSHLRGTPRPEVFPFIGTDGEDTEARGLYERDKRRFPSSEERQEEIEYTRDSCDETRRNSSLHELGASAINQLNNPVHSNERVYGVDGISPTLNTMQGGMRQPFVLDTNLNKMVSYSNGKESKLDDGTLESEKKLRKENGSVFGLQGEKANRNTSSERGLARQSEGELGGDLSELSHSPTQKETEVQSGKLQSDSQKIRLLRETQSEVQEVWQSIDVQKKSAYENYRIRRLTPVEAERLQGFPDGWTASVSDSQRYKTLGNAVTVNVIRDIIQKILV